MASQSQIDLLLEMLIERKETLNTSIADKTAQINNLYVDEHSGDDSDKAEAKSVDFKETTIIASQQERIRQIDDAITRISNKTYGICEMCDELIPIGRLKVKPFAKYCIDCREEFEKNEMQRGDIR
jgi:DnaK suppressor protein